MRRGTVGSTTEGTGGDVQKALIQQIDTISTKVEEIQANLPASGSAQAFKSYASYFTSISVTFVNYTRRKGNTYYLFLNHGQGRQRAAKDIINSAKKVAKLFEKYSKKPANYSSVECEIEIAGLLADLASLRFYARQ